MQRQLSHLIGPNSPTQHNTTQHTLRLVKKVFFSASLLTPSPFFGHLVSRLACLVFRGLVSLVSAQVGSSTHHTDCLHCSVSLVEVARSVLFYLACLRACTVNTRLPHFVIALLAALLLLLESCYFSYRHGLSRHSTKAASSAVGSQAARQ